MVRHLYFFRVVTSAITRATTNATTASPITAISSQLVNPMSPTFQGLRREGPVPLGGLLIGVRGSQHRGFIKGTTDHLQSNG